MTVWIDPSGRADLLTFADRALRLDESAVVRLRTRADGLLGAWVATGFDVLAVRVVPGRLQPPDITVSAEGLRAGLRAAGPDGTVDPGFPMDSAWRGALPPEGGFAHLDDVPAPVLDGLARDGVELARTHGGPQGPPASLLDQEVLAVSGADTTVGVPMRCVLALAAMGFLGEVHAGEVVRVRATPVWLRVDARFGSVFRRRQNVSLTPSI